LVNLKIGELAQASGVSRDTIRYYERLKLLPRAGRTQGGYRTYSEDDVNRVRFIKQAQTFGLSLEEVGTLMRAGKAGLEECRQVRDLLDSKLKELDARLAQMGSFRQKLASHLAECETALARKDRDKCPVLFELSHSSSAARSSTIQRKRKGEKQ
jgi:DNA-binding transcriptional MerR regulator